MKRRFFLTVLIFIFFLLSPSTSNKAFAQITSPTPTPSDYWYKIKNTSFYKYGDLNNAIPLSVNKFSNGDPDDNTQRLFDIGDAGVVASAGPSMYFKEAFGQNIASTHGWRITNYIKKNPPNMTTNKFLQYVYSRKNYVRITDINDIQQNKINVYSGNLNINDNGIAAASRTPFVLIVDGDLTINVGQTLNSSAKPRPLAMLATGTLNITSTTEEINGIFIGEAVDLASDGASTSNPLKVKGNLILTSDTTFTPLDATAKRIRADTSRPSTFAVLDLGQYIELLPILSTRNYIYSENQ